MPCEQSGSGLVVAMDLSDSEIVRRVGRCGAFNVAIAAGALALVLSLQAHAAAQGWVAAAGDIWSTGESEESVAWRSLREVSAPTQTHSPSA